MPSQDLSSLKHSPLFRLWTYAHGHSRSVKQATFFSIVNKLFDIAPEILIGVAVDVVVSREHSFLARFGYTDVLSQLWILGGLTFLIWVCESISEYLYEIRWRNLAQTIQHELRLDAYSHIQKLDMAYFETKSTGGLLSILNDDINQLERFLDGGANALIQLFTTVVVIGGLFFVLSPSVAFFAFMPIPFILAGAFYYQKRLSPRYTSVREQVGNLNARLANNVTGIATIKSYVAEARELEQITQESQNYRKANAKAIEASSAFVPLIRMGVLSGFLMTLVYGGFLTVRGELAVGSYSVLVFLTQRLLWPLTGLAQTVDLYQRAMASTRRVLDLLSTPIHIAEGGRELTVQDVKGKIEFRKVVFSYQEDLPVLKNVSLEIPAGKTYAFVGTTGSGKSTLVKLLLRFYAPQQGTLTLDDVPLEEVTLQSLRAQIGFVSQDVFLVPSTIKENISYGNPSASQEQIESAAKAAEAHDFVKELPQGYDTLVGERGQKLSGGQRQRLSIARAVLKDPPILILDEATSAVDNETEAAIQKSLSTISAGRTTLIIAHRLSTIRHADCICVLEKGQIIEKGTHEHLLTQGGVYAHLWQVQTGETSKK
jgi:ATP-binding cassette, subfamily B, bacterial